MSETVKMSCAWRNHDPSRGSWQRALKSLSWEQHCLWAWTGGWQERSPLISASQTFPSSSCAWLSSKYHPSAPHHRAQNFSRPLRVLPPSMLRKGRKRQEQEGHGRGETQWHCKTTWYLSPFSLHFYMQGSCTPTNTRSPHVWGGTVGAGQKGQLEVFITLFT